jgi:hypothetical protein
MNWSLKQEPNGSIYIKQSKSGMQILVVVLTVLGFCVIPQYLLAMMYSQPAHLSCVKNAEGFSTCSLLRSGRGSTSKKTTIDDILDVQFTGSEGQNNTTISAHDGNTLTIALSRTQYESLYQFVHTNTTRHHRLKS